MFERYYERNVYIEKQIVCLSDETLKLHVLQSHNVILIIHILFIYHRVPRHIWGHGFVKVGDTDLKRRFQVSWCEIINYYNYLKYMSYLAEHQVHFGRCRSHFTHVIRPVYRRTVLQCMTRVVKIENYHKSPSDFS